MKYAAPSSISTGPSRIAQQQISKVRTPKRAEKQQTPAASNPVANEPRSKRGGTDSHARPYRDRAKDAVFGGSRRSMSGGGMEWFT